MIVQRHQVAAGDAPLVLGRYRLHRRLGAGAFGTVWAAHDERLEREVAVKILPRERVIGGRFEREARVAARLSHPAIVTLYEAAVDDEGAYLVSELVRGATLARLLESGRMSDREIVRLGIALCDALAHAHAQEVIHRDVKPSNVLIPQRPVSPAYPAKLTDFGVAQVVGGDSLTRTGDVVGTAAYMAPEQAEGRPVGPEADLYALALVLYESLTGVNPVQLGVSATSTARPRRLGTHLPPLRRQRRELPRELGAGIDLALRPRPRERGTLQEFRAALETALPETGERRGVVAPPWRPQTRSQARGETARTQPAARTWRRPDPTETRQQLPPPVRFDSSTPDAIPWPLHAAAAAGAAGTVAWLVSLGLIAGGLPTSAYAVVAAVLVLALPRIGWIAVVTALAVLCAASGHAGAALVIAPALLIPVLLVPRRGRVWPLPAAAVALGMISLAGAWPAVAGRSASSFWRRAVLGAVGFVWLTLAEQLTGSDLFLPRAATVPAPAVWAASPTLTIDRVVPVLLSPGVLAGAAVWALAAAVLPWLARGRTLAAKLVLVTIWATSLVSATAVAVTVGGVDRTPAGSVAVLGALAGGVVALSPTRRRATEGGGIAEELP
jgi:serine/threonine protein kinase